MEGVGFTVCILDGGEKEFWELCRASDLGIEKGSGGFEEEGVFG